MTQSSDGKPQPTQPGTSGDLDQRRARLDQELKRRSDLKQAEGAGAQASRSDVSGLALALRLGSEFVAAVIVGGFIGWGLDKLLGWSPWGMIVFLLLGFVAGVLNVMRSAGLMKRPGG